MFFELAKDKSLLNVLRKAKLDDNTSMLVKEMADVSSIKASLIENMNPQNMIAYRKYITIAKQEEDEAGSARASEEEGYTAPVDSAEEQAQIDARIAENRYGEEFSRSVEEESAYKILSNLNFQADILMEIASEARVSRVEGKLVVRGIMQSYSRLGSTSTNSSNLLGFLTMLKRNNNFLEDEYGKFLVDGVLSGKMYKYTKKGREEVSKGPDINVLNLQGLLNDIVETEFEVDGEKIDFLEVFRTIHKQRWKREPRSLVPRTKVKDERLRMLQRAKKTTADVGVNREYERALRRINATQEYTSRIMNTKVFIEEKIEMIKETIENPDKLVARQVRKLNAALRRVIASSGKKRDVKDNYAKRVGSIKQISSMLRDIDKNKEKHIEDAKKELIKELKAEERKLERLQVDLDTFDRLKPTLKNFRTILNIFRQGDPLPEIKEQLTKGANISFDLSRYAKQMEKVASKAKGEVEQGLMDYFESNPDAKMILEADGGYFEGAPTIDAVSSAKFEELSLKYQEKAEELQEVVNFIESKIGDKMPKNLPTKESKKFFKDPPKEE
tara:strand:- start:42 stop:1715 length:1674 start_codon:yes stop_codon:yes gene_type:complete